LVGLVILAANFLVCGAVAQAQQSAKIRRVGVLRGDSPGTLPVETFQQAMRDLGYLEGKNIVIEYRFAEGKVDRLANLAEELVRLNVEVIWAAGPAVPHAKNATKTIPIVITNVSDPVGSGYVDSMARPGGNITGLASLQRGLNGKRLEVLKEAIPKLSRVAFFGNSKVPGNPQVLKETEVAAKTFGLQVQYLDVQTPQEIEPAFQAANKGRAQALLVLRNPLTAIHHPQIAELAGKRRLPTMYGDREFVEAGGLMSYGPDQVFIYRRVAAYVDKILKGTKPADLPVEGPTKFELVINLKTAKQIGLTIPPNVLARADKVIR
jgi:putative ABC transport system substrate-binding protein